MLAGSDHACAAAVGHMCCSTAAWIPLIESEHTGKALRARAACVAHAQHAPASMAASSSTQICVFIVIYAFLPSLQMAESDWWKVVMITMGARLKSSVRLVNKWTILWTCNCSAVS